MKFKVGDKVKIKEDLSWRKKYKTLITPQMEVHKGKIAKIVAITRRGSYILDIEDRPWHWSEDTLEPVEKKVFTKSDLKDGDIVTYRSGTSGIKNGNMILESGDSHFYNELEDYTEDLKYKNNENKHLDIIKVERPSKYEIIFGKAEIKEKNITGIEKECLEQIIQLFLGGTHE